MRIPRIIISGLSGGAGKTMLSLGLARALGRQGVRVRAFKKGPDYIDAAWLALAAHAPTANLDSYFSSPEQLRALFAEAAAGYDFALIEGNRGLFDGLDLSGCCSTSELARILDAPVLLVLDCTKMTRTAAAVVKGCLDFEPDLHLGGVILNRTGNPRHQNIVRRAVQELAGLPVLGVLPRQAEPLIVERHMGLVGSAESASADALLDRLADFVAAHVDLEAITALAASVSGLPASSAASFDAAAAAKIGSSPELKDDTPACSNPPLQTGPPPGTRSAAAPARPVIGYVLDAAFWFYYQENLQALERAGARLAPVSLLETTAWPRLDGLYLGGGLPELHAAALSANVRNRAHVAELSEKGLPIYAECGGFMFLAKSIIYHETVYPMAAVFSCAVEFCSRPQGLGYVQAEVVEENPYHPRGQWFRGHEFHFSRCIPAETYAPAEESRHVLRLHKGRGMAQGPGGGGMDGLLTRNTFASYCHIYAPSLPHWAPAFLSLC